jgi:hypothetical protein
MTGNYVPLEKPPWDYENWKNGPQLDTKKVHTDLTEYFVPKAKPYEMAVPDEGETPEAHQGWEKLRALQKAMRDALLACDNAGQFWCLVQKWTDPRPQPTEITLGELTNELIVRMNKPDMPPTGFNLLQLQLDKELAESLPSKSLDTSPDKLFSRDFDLDEIAWAKRHIKKHSKDSACGIDIFSYEEILAIPNENIRTVLNASSEWLVLEGFTCRCSELEST